MATFQDIYKGFTLTLTENVNVKLYIALISTSKIVMALMVWHLKDKQK